MMNEKAMATVLTNLYRSYWEDQEESGGDNEKFDYFLAEIYIGELIKALKEKWPVALKAFEAAIVAQDDLEEVMRGVHG